MPGKQMAIDADLNAGLINQEEARTRRVEVRAEADFYGSMDGASKFVRGDAMAGILILFDQHRRRHRHRHDCSTACRSGEAARTYTLLTIGDGLVAQIPSLLLSTAAAIIVTAYVRVAGHGRRDDRPAVRSSPGRWRSLPVLLTIMGAIPGMPNIAFLPMAALCGGGAWLLHRRSRARARGRRSHARQPPAATETREL